MRGGALAGLTVVAALLVLGTATATWATVSIPGAVIDGIQLPDTTQDYTGAAEAPASILAAALAFSAVVPVSLVGPADRVDGRGAGTAARVLASAAGVGVAVAAAVALLIPLSVDVIVLGGATASVVGSPAQALFGVGALLVLALTLLSWRIPRTPAATEASRYTVEAVRGEVTPPPVEDEVDEWDLAVAPEPAPDRSDPDRRDRS